MPVYSTEKILPNFGLCKLKWNVPWYTIRSKNAKVHVALQRRCFWWLDIFILMVMHRLLERNSRNNSLNRMMVAWYVIFGICYKQHFDTKYLVFYNPSLPRMFLSLDLLSEYRIQHGANGPLYVTSSYSTWIFCRGVSGFVTTCHCGVWCRGLNTYMLVHLLEIEF